MTARPTTLVTGATGFVGRAIVARLLADGRSVAALVRTRDSVPAATRLAAALGRPLPAGLRVVDADLTADVTRAGWDDVRDTVDTVIHCAGDTSFFPDDVKAFRAGHVDGPRAVLETLTPGRLTTWVQVSTAYVCGRRLGRAREDDDDVGQRFHNVYERTKLDAEQALRAAGSARSVDVRVVRPSIVVGPAPATAGGGPATLFLDFIRLVAAVGRLGGGERVRVAAAPRARFNIVPVEHVAAATVALAQRREAAGGTFHVVADVPTQQAMLDLIQDRLGATAIDLVDGAAAEWPDASSLERRVARMLAGYREYLEQDVVFDDTRARSVLDRAGVPPAVLDAAAVGRLVDLALDERPAIAGEARW